MKIEPKSQPIAYYWVAQAYRSVKRGGKASGVDEKSMADFEGNLNANLYKLWNRLTSGSYMPPPVREAELTKPTGGIRKLGIPTVSDRIAQRVVKDYMEPKLEGKFHRWSYGYRPGRSAHQAIGQCLTNTRRYGWVIDLDIKGFFDHIDHELLLRALSHDFSEKWVLMYVERWLKAPIQEAGGQLREREAGTPQGGVISPLLSNLFLHYGLDEWLRRNHPTLKFERYADDMVLHCSSEQESVALLSAIKSRLKEMKLELNESKTQIVYCKKSGRTCNYEKVTFDFLGHQFKPKRARDKYGRKFLTYGLEMSQGSASRVLAELRRMGIHRKTGFTIEQLAKELNPKLRGWMSYYGKYGGNRFNHVLHRLNTRLMKWVRWRHKLRFRTGKIIDKLLSYYRKNPNLFAHWKMIKPMRAWTV